MACFLVPASEAIITTVATKIIEKKEHDDIEYKLENDIAVSEVNKTSVSQHLKRLNGLLWGGSGLLAFEHLWHGEIQPFFPFLTAAANPSDAVDMLHEMSTVGVSMAVLVTAVWGLSTFALKNIEKKEDTKQEI